MISSSSSSSSEKDWIPLTPDSPDTKIAALTSWLEKECPDDLHGLENLFVGNFEKGGKIVRGVGTLKDIEKGEIVACVPIKCSFGPRHLSERYKKLKEKHPDVCTDEHAFFLADEFRKGKNSFFGAYLGMMYPIDFYMDFHPAMARRAGRFAYEKCVQAGKSKISP